MFKVEKSSNVLCAGLGEVLFDIYGSCKKLGGAPANFAFHCMKNGLDSIVISSVGNDDLGALAKDILKSFNLNTCLVDNEKQTGFVNIKLDDKGVPSYIFQSDTAYDNILLTEDLKNLAPKLDVVCFGTLAQRHKVSLNTIISFLDLTKSDCIKIFDVNLRSNFYTKEIIENSLKRTNIFKCNDEELIVLSKLFSLKDSRAQTFYNFLNTFGINCFVLTNGSLDSTVFLNDEISTIKTPKVEVVDTTGAGDAFIATFISSLLKKESMQTAHQKAVEYAAFVCTYKGAMM